MFRFGIGGLLITMTALAMVTAMSIRLQSDRASAATSATFTVANGGTHAVTESFSITVALSNVTFDANSPKWVGYDLELDYDPQVLTATNVAPALCPPSAWSSTSLTPGVVTGCFYPAGSTATSGVLETITFTCQANGTTSLHLPAHHAGTVGSGNGLFDASATDFSMTLADSSVVCGTGVNDPTSTPTPVPPTPTPTATPNFSGMATIGVSSGGTHAVNESFTVTTNLSNVVFGTSTSWAGYLLELDYDTNVLVATGAAPTLCSSSGWSLLSTIPSVSTGCAFQNSTATSGELETITFTCLADGTSSLQLAAQPVDVVYGTENFLPYQMTLQSSSVVCGTGVNGPTFTPTSTMPPTATPTGGPGAATLMAVVPSSAQPLNMPFLLRTKLSSFSAGSHAAWAGYEIMLEYDPGIIAIDYASPTLCPPSNWGYHVGSPPAQTACVAFQSTSTGILDTLVAKCLNDGTTALHFVSDPTTSVLFDVNGVSFPTTLQDASVVCDRHVDDDGDGCRSTTEPTLGLDPQNPWDFYSVPVPALFAAPNPRLVFKDAVVTATDAQVVFAYYKAGAKAGTTVYEQDLNGNGTPDGMEYDRSVIGPAKSGPPDGAVSAQEAQLALAQYRLNYRC